MKQNELEEILIEYLGCSLATEEVFNGKLVSENGKTQDPLQQQIMSKECGWKAVKMKTIPNCKFIFSVLTLLRCSLCSRPLGENVGVLHSVVFLSSIPCSLLTDQGILVKRTSAAKIASFRMPCNVINTVHFLHTFWCDKWSLTAQYNIIQQLVLAERFDWTKGIP